jgi:hypothetical protein
VRHSHMPHCLNEFRLIPLLLLAAFPEPAVVMAQASVPPPLTSIQGIVTDEKNMPINGAGVYVEDDCDTPRAVTDSQGRFVLADLPDTRHLIRVYADNDAKSGSYIYQNSDQNPSPIQIYAADPPVTVAGAIAGRPYVYRIGVTGSGMADFLPIRGGNARWLTVTKDGMLEGLTPLNASHRSTIGVRACGVGKTPLRRVFVVPVETLPCAASGDLDWCERNPGAVEVSPTTVRFSEEAVLTEKLEQWEGPRIIQFSRVEGDHGAFGNLDHFRSKVVSSVDAVMFAPQAPSLVNAVNGSKVPLSGSILVQKGVPNCSAYQWRVVTLSVDSSNVLVYGSSEVNTFCDKNTLLIVLPVHSKWATVVGSRAETFDPTWKPVGAPPPARECNGSDPVSLAGVPSEGIRPCDDLPGSKAGPIYWAPISWAYIRFTQPGATQGGISLAPYAIAPKGTWDTQAYVSTQAWLGWAGIISMYEHDHKAQDDLNSLTAALTYDFRLGKDQMQWYPFKKPTENRTYQADPVFGMRLPEINLRYGPEWSPAVKLGGPGNDTILRENLNMVGAEVIKFPWVVNIPPGWKSFRRQPQQSMLSIIPLIGAEEGSRVIFHDSGAAEPEGMIRRLVAGGDASMRLPYILTHNVLGDRPITLEYSFRARRLGSDEPILDARSQIEALAAGWRSYSRVTLIMPFSPYVQVRAVLQHGALPPIYQWVGSLFTMSVTFSNPGSSEH